MIVRYHKTYETITPESAEYGDAADHGFVAKNLEVSDDDELIEMLRNTEPSEWPINNLRNIWFTEILDAEEIDGSETTYSYHPADTWSALDMVCAWRAAQKRY